MCNDDRGQHSNSWGSQQLSSTSRGFFGFVVNDMIRSAIQKLIRALAMGVWHGQSNVVLHYNNQTVGGNLARRQGPSVVAPIELQRIMDLNKDRFVESLEMI